jgi:phage-related protein
MKRVRFLGDSLEVIRAFPPSARREAGFQIERVQRSLEPDDWKPMKTVGQGVREIRVRDRASAFRVIYVATFGDAIFVLHAFQKKTRATPRRDLELAAARFKILAQRSRQ